MSRPPVAGLVVLLAAALGRALVVRAAPTALPPALGAPPAVAARARVTVVPARDGDPVVVEALNRVRFELAAEGWLTTPDGAAGAIAPATGAAATIRGQVSIARAGAEAFVVEVDASAASDPLAGGRRGPQRRRVEVAVTASVDAAAVLAIRAVELVRAAILEATAGAGGSAAGGPPRPSPSISPSSSLFSPTPAMGARPVATPARARWSLALGAVGLQSVRGFGTALGPAARAAIHLSPLVAVSLQLAAPLLARDLRVTDDTASLRQMLGGAGVRYAFRPGRALRPSLSVAAGLYHLGVSGRGTPGRPLTPSSSSPFVAAGLGLTLASRAAFALGLRAEAVLVGSAPYVTIGGVDAGHAGRPLWLATLEAEWPLPPGSLR